VQLDQGQLELETTQATLRDQQSKVLVLRNVLADMEARALAAESSKKKLETELEEMIQTQQDRNVADLERVRRDLQAKVDEQAAHLLELEDDVTLATDAKMRSEMMQAKLQDELRVARETAQEQAAVEAMEGKLKALQRQVVELQNEADAERRSKTKLAADKRKLEQDIVVGVENLAEERKSREREVKLREAAEKRLQQNASSDVAGVLAASDTRELDRLKAKIKLSKSEVDELETQVASERCAKRRAEHELEEKQDLVGFQEREISELKTQLRRILTAMQSGDVTLKKSDTEA